MGSIPLVFIEKIYLRVSAKAPLQQATGRLHCLAFLVVRDFYDVSERRGRIRIPLRVYSILFLYGFGAWIDTLAGSPETRKATAEDCLRVT